MLKFNGNADGQGPNYIRPEYIGTVDVDGTQMTITTIHNKVYILNWDEKTIKEFLEYFDKVIGIETDEESSS